MTRVTLRTTLIEETTVPRQPKAPNRLLADLLAETGLPAKGLARRVVARGADRGVDLGYDHNSVRRWLEGEQPLPPAPHLIAEVISEHLGRTITPDACGFAGGSVDVALEFGMSWTDGIAAADALYRADAERRRALTTAAYSTAAYPSTAVRWLTLPGGDVPAHRGRSRVGRPEIAALRQMTRAFRALDNEFGGGRVRATVVQYLHSNVAPLLRGTYTEEIGKALFSAAAELTREVGWMAYDLEEHGIAQRYLVQSLRMAQTAGDDALCAEVLAAMGHQATYVGRGGDAVDLARAAQIAARRAGHPALMAECLLIEAHGHAVRLDGRACSTALAAGERAFDRDDPNAPEWLRFFDDAYLAARIAHCFRSMGSDAQTARYADRSLDMDNSFVRGRAFNLLMLAGARAAEDPVEAARVGEEAVSLVEGLESRRAVSYLRDVQHRLRPHCGMPEVAAFQVRAGELTTAA
jgi:hypothetical protein